LSYLLDTNVLSELKRRQPDIRVLRWVESRPADTLFLSVLTVGELRHGVQRLPAGAKRQQLEDWLEIELPDWFIGRLLPVDERVARRWGDLVAAAGRPLPVIDSLLAATALAHNLTLVTRNGHDFQYAGLTLHDPWAY
jgi:toxin FitB